jgi:hypothetical protein
VIGSAGFIHAGEEPHPLRFASPRSARGRGVSNARHQVRSEALDAGKAWVLSARCRLHAAARYSAAARESSLGREIAFWHHTGIGDQVGPEHAGIVVRT